MNSYSINKTEILNKISLIHPDMLPEIDKYLDFLNYKKNMKNIKFQHKSLKGIWKNCGFEKLNIEKEISKLCAEAEKDLNSIKI